ncbi:MAG: exodeoxyribonuclease VII large subunit [Gorillibacterium sp.]|nr:exodeoxyribonuclease VII large subunit [Gorillibacterium sp.]
MPKPVSSRSNSQHTSEDQILSIKDLNRLIKRMLEGESMLQDVWVRGEISNFIHHASGHMYFTLKDTDSRLKSIMFASSNQRLPFLPKEGTRVLARGSISVFERDGQYQFYVNQMQPDGIGSLYLAYEQLKKRLEEEGLFAPQFKKQLPRYPQTIGVITSPSGAAVRDILITLKRRYPSVNILLYPVLVQGTGAAGSIAHAIDSMNQQNEAEVLIVGRGGGSLEELWAFNEEVVARSVYASAIPVVSAVGHETDYTICDFVADLRAATPTAAAELVVPHYLELRQQLRGRTAQLQKALLYKLQQQKERLQQMERSQALANPRRMFQQPVERHDRLKEQLFFRMKTKLSVERQRKMRLDHSIASFNPKEQVLFAKRRAESAHKGLIQAMRGSLKSKKSEWDFQIRQLDALSPLKVMSRGYSLVYDEQEKTLIKAIDGVQLGDLIKVRLTDGKLTAHVWSMERANDGK